MVTAKIKTTKTGNPLCGCNCGAVTKGGRFRPGHDAKLKGQLLLALRDGTAGEKRSAQAKAKAQGWKLNGVK